MKRFVWLAPILLAAPTACKVDVGSEPGKYVQRVLAGFDPTLGIIPMPNDQVATVDDKGRHLAIPTSITLPDGTTKDTFSTPEGKAYVENYLNKLDGFPTSMPMTVAFMGAINEDSLREQPPSADVLATPVKTGAVRVFDVTAIREAVAAAAAGGALDLTAVSVTEVTGLTVSAPKEKTDAAGGKYWDASVTIPRSLAAGHVYMGFLTSIVKDQKANPVVSPTAFNFVKAKDPLVTDKGAAVPPIADEDAARLEVIRAGLKPYLDYFESAKTPAEVRIPREQAVLAWTWTVSAGSEAMFDPSIGVIPFPFDGLIDQKTGKVSLPVNSKDPDAVKAITAGLNTLDGFSNLGPTTVGFSKPLDPASFQLTASLADVVGGNIKGITVADITDVNPNDQATLVALAPYGSDRLTATFANGQLVISPVDGKPLPPNRRFIVVLLDKLQTSEEDQGGKKTRPPFHVSPVFWFARSPDPLIDKDNKSRYPEALSDKDAAALEPLRAAYEPLLDVMESMLQVPRSSVLMIFSFTTAGTTKELADLVATLPLQDHAVTSEKGLQTPASQDVKFVFGDDPTDHIGYACVTCSVDISSLLAAPDLKDPKAPVMGHFTFDKDGKPVWKKEQKLPFLLTVPSGQGPFDVVVFGHGLNGNRKKMTKIADDLAAAGFVAVAFDAPLHGDHPIKIDDNGTGFFNADVFSVRDNIRQGALDQAQFLKFVKAKDGLNKFIKDQLSLSDEPLDTTKVVYLGVSLGGIIGEVSAGVNKDYERVALVVTGGHLTRIFLETPNEDFRKPLIDSLAALGIPEGSAAFTQFIMIAQWALDRADPLNFAVNSKATDQKASERYLVVKAIGDDFIPNTTTEELKVALDQADDTSPQFKEYPSGGGKLCHGFFMDGCDPGKFPSWEENRKAARQAVIDFLKM